MEPRALLTEWGLTQTAWNELSPQSRKRFLRFAAKFIENRASVSRTETKKLAKTVSSINRKLLQRKVARLRAEYKAIDPDLVSTYSQRQVRQLFRMLSGRTRRGKPLPRVKTISPRELDEMIEREANHTFELFLQHRQWERGATLDSMRTDAAYESFKRQAREKIMGEIAAASAEAQRKRDRILRQRKNRRLRKARK